MPECYRIFLSSPGDVELERRIAQEVVDRFNQSRQDGPVFDLFRWEETFYTADSTFQDQVPSPEVCDLVICLFWKRLGTELPESYRRPDGTTPTGTEHEFELAMQAAATADPKLPDVLVYRKDADLTFNQQTYELEKAQYEQFRTFWSRWFQSEQGHFVAAFQTFKDPDEFAGMLEEHLTDWLARRSDDAIWTEGSPYRGLRPYEFEHAPIFFGRRREVERCRARLIAAALAGPGFLMILGPSGSGKSSLVRAGLLPRLSGAGGLSGIADRMCRATVTPEGIRTQPDGPNWPLGLAEALFGETALGPELSESDFSTAAALSQLIATAPGPAVAVIKGALQRSDARLGLEGSEAPERSVALALVIDQFEELFQWPADETDTFLALIEAMTGADKPGQDGAGPRILVLATMRSDFQHRLAEWPVLARITGQQEARGPGAVDRRIEIIPPGHADMRDIISGPARAAGLILEADAETSLQQVLEDEADPSALPALQYLLSELYQRRDDKTLTLEAHGKLKGVAGVMATRGEAVLRDVGPDVAAGFPRLMRALIAPGMGDGADTARTVAASTFSGESPEARLAAALLEARLLTSDEGRMRISHESLLTGWDRLQRQIADDGRLLQIRDRLAQMHSRYAAEPGRNRALLLTGFPLAEGRELLTAWGTDGVADKDPGLPAYINRSVSADRTRRWSRIGAGLAAVCVIIGAVAMLLRQQALTEDAAQEAALRLQIGNAETAMRNLDFDRATGTALAAYQLEDRVETRSSLLGAIAATSPYLQQTIAVQATAIAASDDMTWIATEDALIEVATSSDQMTSVPFAPSLPVVALQSWDGEMLLAVNEEGGIALIEKSSGSERSLAPLASPPFLVRPNQISIRRTETGLVAAFADNSEQIWLRRCEVTAQIVCSDEVPDRAITPWISTISLSPDGTRVAYAQPAGFRDGEESELVIHELSTDERRKPWIPPAADGWGHEIISVAWSPDGSRIAFGTREGLTAVIPADRDTEVIRPVKHRTPKTFLRWSADGRHLAYPCDLGVVCINDLDQNDVSLHGPDVLKGHRGAIGDIAFLHSGQLTSFDEERTVRGWTLGATNAPVESIVDPTELVPLEADEPLTRVAVWSGSDTIFLSSGTGNIWSKSSAQAPRSELEIFTLTDNAGYWGIEDFAVRDDGKVAVIHEEGGLALWPRPGSDEEPLLVDFPNGNRFRHLTWLPDGAHLAVTDGLQSVHLITETGDLEDQAPYPPGSSPFGITATPGGEVIVSQGNSGLMIHDPAGWRVLYSPEEVGDDKAARSLSVHPGGRWLTATRSDDLIKIYDLTGALPPVELPLFQIDSKTVAFSPDGTKLAALGSDGYIYLWRFDAATGKAEAEFQIPDLTALMNPRVETRGRPVTWLAWRGPERLLASTALGEVVEIAIDPQALARRAAQLTPVAPR